MEAFSDQSGHRPQGWRNVSIMCDVESWGRVGNNMTFSMHKNINTQFMLLGHLNMTDEKEKYLFKIITWCEADGSQSQGKGGLINDFHTSHTKIF